MTKQMLLLLAVLALSACGGGDGGKGDNNTGGNTPPPSTPEPEPEPEPITVGGYYFGQLQSTHYGALWAEGLIFEDGRALFTTMDGIFMTSVAPEGDDKVEESIRVYTTEMSGWTAEPQGAPGIVTGEIVPKEGIFLAYEIPGDSGIISLEYDARMYEVPVSIARLVGTWGYTLDNGYWISVSIDATGSFFGQDVNECVYMGKISLPDPDKNLFDIEEAGVQCGYTGYAGDGAGFLAETEDGQEVFVFGVGLENGGALVDYWDRQ